MRKHCTKDQRTGCTELKYYQNIQFYLFIYAQEYHLPLQKITITSCFRVNAIRTEMQ